LCVIERSLHATCVDVLAPADQSKRFVPHISATLSLHDALPISRQLRPRRRSGERNAPGEPAFGVPRTARELGSARDRQARDLQRNRKSTRLNSSHGSISYAGYCLKKKKSESYNRSRVHTTTLVS